MTNNPALDLTAGDLMSRYVVTLSPRTSLREAAYLLRHHPEVEVPVVDDDGACVGVLSAAALSQADCEVQRPSPALPRTCSHQTRRREPGGEEVVVCNLPGGVCPLQGSRPGSDEVRCTQPHCVPCDWQVVEMEGMPEEEVARVMTADPFTVPAAMSVRDLHREMSRTNSRRAVVVDGQRRPIGFVMMPIVVAALAQALNQWSTSPSGSDRVQRTE